MSLHQTLTICNLIDKHNINGQDVVDLFCQYPGIIPSTHRVMSSDGMIDFVRVVIPGKNGKLRHGEAATLSIVSRYDRYQSHQVNEQISAVADGAVVCLACVLKLAEMQTKGQFLAGDVIVTTRLYPDGLPLPHEPVDFIHSVMDIEAMNEHDIDQTADAFLSIGIQKDKPILQHNCYAISPTVKQAYILRVSEDLLRIMEQSSGLNATTFPVTTLDITPYGNGVDHFNNVLQPAIATDAPVVGIVISADKKSTATYARNEVDISTVVKFIIQVAKEFGQGTCSFFDYYEFALLQSLYGNMSHLQMRK